MNDESERYELVHNPATQEPIGVTDLWQPGAMAVQDWPPQQVPSAVNQPVYQPIPMQVHVPVAAYQRSRLPGAIRVRLYLYGAAVIFAAGMAVSAWFFGDRQQAAPTVVVCPAPGVQVAALPAECGAPQHQAVPR